MADSNSPALISVPKGLRPGDAPSGIEWPKRLWIILPASASTSQSESLSHLRMHVSEHADLSVIDANISSIESQLGSVDILINNTGGPPPTSAAGQDPALWLKQFQSLIFSSPPS